MHAQATMVASWVVELYLDQINRALLEDTAEGARTGAEQGEALRSFLRDNVRVLDVNVTVSLLASYGRMDDLMHYATYRQARQRSCDTALSPEDDSIWVPGVVGQQVCNRVWRLQDNETVLEYLLQRGEALKALAVLRRPGVSQELVYKFAPVLLFVACCRLDRVPVMHSAKNAVVLHITSSPRWRSLWWLRCRRRRWTRGWQPLRPLSHDG